MLVTVKYKLCTRVSAGEAGVTADSGGGWRVEGGRWWWARDGVRGKGEAFGALEWPNAGAVAERDASAAR